MAKGLEDTALYRFNRLIARNEVGSRPGHPAVSVAEFHAANAERLARTPRTMLTTSTHDTKRGEDARARIAALTRHARLWGEKVWEWHAMLADPDQPIDRNEEFFFYQLLLGAWPVEWRRSDEIATERSRGLRGSGGGCDAQVIAGGGREHALDLRRCHLRGRACRICRPRADAAGPLLYSPSGRSRRPWWRTPPRSPSPRSS